MPDGLAGPLIQDLESLPLGGDEGATTAESGIGVRPSLLPVPRGERLPVSDVPAQLPGRAARAQEQFRGWSETSTDGLLRDIATPLTAAAPRLAALTVRETGIGNVSDKIRKITHASRGVADEIIG